MAEETKTQLDDIFDFGQYLGPSAPRHGEDKGVIVSAPGMTVRAIQNSKEFEIVVESDDGRSLHLESDATFFNSGGEEHELARSDISDMATPDVAGGYQHHKGSRMTFEAGIRTFARHVVPEVHTRMAAKKADYMLSHDADKLFELYS